MRHYLLHIIGDVWPTIRGPYKSPLTRDKAALRIRAKIGEEDSIFKLDCPASYTMRKTKPAVSAYSSEFMERVTGKDL
jgi:hypothetical protein